MGASLSLLPFPFTFPAFLLTYLQHLRTIYLT